MFKARILYCFVLAAIAVAAPAGNSLSASISTASAPPSTSSLSATSIATFATSSASGGSMDHSSRTSTAPSEEQTVPPASDAPNYPAWSQDTDIIPEAINGQLGATVLGPDNVELDRQNPDLLAPPSTDSGTVPNAKWPFSLSNNQLNTGGFARQQNIDSFPIATAMASVDMRLQAGAIRELHWHKTAEWAYVLKGSTTITTVNTDGQVYVDTVGPGDLWYFPPGIPHSLQATAEDPDGSEFLLVFDDGSFSETTTFELIDWMAHVPKEVLAKNFQVDISAFNNLPSRDLYIFPSSPPVNETAPEDPNGVVPSPFTYKLSQVEATPLSGGSIKVFDTRTFAVANTIVGALVSVEPGGMRELHWHPTEPEWSYFLSGEGRMTIYASSGNAKTFDYRAGDIGYVPPSYGHYIENTGNTTMEFLEIFNSDIVEDISLNQWLALTPPAIVKAHLGVDDATIAQFNKTKQTVVGPR